MPLIRHLLARGHAVTAAGNAVQAAFLRNTFPHLEVAPLKGYDVRYSHTARGFLPRLLAQGPRLMRCVKLEHRWLQGLLEHRDFDGIISDNRYGLCHPRVPSVILTHQLSPRTGLGVVPDAVLRRLHYRALQKFGAVWVVDVPEAPGLSGALGHPSTVPRSAQYIGLLSGMAEEKSFGSGGENPLLVLLSGPEPQRTVLSELLWKEVAIHPGPVVFVEGTTSAPRPAAGPPHIRWHAQLSPAALRPLLESAPLVICRSGYSTLMDLAALGKRAILIPTPGQTEQEYLARRLHHNGIFLRCAQKDFRLEEVLEAAVRFPFHPLYMPRAHCLFEPVLDAWVEGLGAANLSNGAVPDY